MEKSRKTVRTSITLFIMCWLCYAIVSMTKNAYSASIAAIVDEGIFFKAQAGTINSGFYLLYGAAQLFGGKIIDRVSPSILVGVAILGTAVASIGMSLSDSFIMMLVIWSLCGLLQFAIWPSILRVIAEYLLPNHKRKAMVYIAFAYCIGLLFNYITAAVILDGWTWQTLFRFNSMLLLVTFAVWIAFSGRMLRTLERDKTEKVVEEVVDTEEKAEFGFGKLMTMSGLLILLVPALFRTCLDLGIKSWIPTMIMENYEVSVSFATILAAVIAVVNLFGVFLTGYIYPRKIKNVVTVFGIYMLVAVPFYAGILFIGKVDLWVILTLLMITNIIMYAAHQVINVIVPSFFSKYNKSGSTAGILNALASFGAVIANIAFGALADSFGWSGTVWAWVIMSGISAIFCFFAMARWGKFVNR